MAVFLERPVRRRRQDEMNRTGAQSPERPRISLKQLMASWYRTHRIVDEAHQARIFRDRRNRRLRVRERPQLIRNPMPEIVGAFVRCHGSSLAQRLAPPQPIMLPDGMPEDISDGPVLPSNDQASAARRLWRRVGWRPRLGRVLASFRSIASNETSSPLGFLSELY